MSGAGTVRMLRGHYRNRIGEIVVARNGKYDIKLYPEGRRSTDKNALNELGVTITNCDRNDFEYVN